LIMTNCSETNIDNFHNQNIIFSQQCEINDLYVLSNHNVASIFKEDVRSI
jgi:hypothetical protein